MCAPALLLSKPHFFLGQPKILKIIDFPQPRIEEPIHLLPFLQHAELLPRTSAISTSVGQWCWRSNAYISPVGTPRIFSESDFSYLISSPYTIACSKIFHLWYKDPIDPKWPPPTIFGTLLSQFYPPVHTSATTTKNLLSHRIK